METAAAAATLAGKGREAVKESEEGGGRGGRQGEGDRGREAGKGKEAVKESEEG